LFAAQPSFETFVVIGLFGILFSTKIALTLKHDPSPKSHWWWIGFQWISVIYQIFFSYQTFAWIEGQNHLKLIVVIYTPMEVFVVCAILVIFPALREADSPPPVESSNARNEPQVLLSTNSDEQPPSYEVAISMPKP
jgi:hypothetical protein